MIAIEIRLFFDTQNKSYHQDICDPYPFFVVVTFVIWPVAFFCRRSNARFLCCSSSTTGVFAPSRHHNHHTAAAAASNGRQELLA